MKMTNTGNSTGTKSTDMPNMQQQTNSKMIMPKASFACADNSVKGQSMTSNPQSASITSNLASPSVSKFTAAIAKADNSVKG